MKRSSSIRASSSAPVFPAKEQICVFLLERPQPAKRVAPVASCSICGDHREGSCPWRGRVAICFEIAVELRERIADAMYLW